MLFRSSGDGKIQLKLDSDYRNNEPVQPGQAVFAVDDAWGIDVAAKEQSLVKNPRPAACYTYGYNPSLFVRKLAVILALLDSPQSKEVSGSEWSGAGSFGPMIDAAKVLRPKTIQGPSQAPGYDFSSVTSIRDPNFLPGALRFGNSSGLHTTASELSK